jgi:hypothetical protein
MQVIHSATIKGYGMIEGGPYMVGSLFNVTETAEVLAMESVANMTVNAIKGLIDDPLNLVGRPSFVLIGEFDDVVSTNQEFAQNLT